ncbi:AAA family ATPase [Mangrovitalea sediminis]|uniref:AAA family ATPase n=1 Tax=Mangrovitalea sediminis TaxID=1982043 RepID=UPI000BE4C43B|nr:AAA family ATPase [Mangrovitalea sediminis]
MKLDRIQVEQLRQFQQPLVLEGLEPGINLIHGPNESGKSTLVRAIRAAFFERHRSSSVDDLRPWGDSAATPTVTLDFEWGGERWHLVKSFLHRKRCDLSIGARSLSGEDAEDRLADLLGYQFSGRGASQPKHWGIPGLLWVEQGTGQVLAEAVNFAGDHLKSALNSLLGEVASTGGDDIIQTVRQQRDALLTSTGRPRGDLQKFSEREEALKSQLDALNARIADYQTQVDRLGQLRQQQRLDEQERPWEEARQQYRKAEQDFQEVERWRQDQRREQQALDSCHQKLELLQEHLRQAEGQQAQLKERERRYHEASNALNRAANQGAGVQDEEVRARDAYERARDMLKLARQQEERRGLQRDLNQLSDNLQTLKDRLGQARTFQQQLKDLQDTQQREGIDFEALKNLRKAEQSLNEARIRSESVATLIDYTLEPGQEFHLDGEPLTGQGHQQLLQEAELAIPGVGRLHITPGGEDLSELRLQLSRLSEEHQRQLATLQVASLAEAESKAERQATRLNDIKYHKDMLANLAPDGLDALTGELESGNRRKEQLQNDLAERPECPGETPSLSSAQGALDVAEKRVGKAQKAARDHQSALASANVQKENAEQEWQLLREELESDAYRSRQKKLKDDIAGAARDRDELQAKVEQRQTRIDQARPDLLQQDMQRYQASADQQEKAFRDRALELTGLQSRLEAEGAEGLEEQRDECLVQHEQAQRRYEELKRRSEALDLLLNLLQEKKQALTRRLQAPLQRHLDHYLNILFPQARLSVDDDLIPMTLSRRGSQGQETGPLEALSFGAREQMGLISRFAYADLLREAGRPTLILLDDTLVHSDRQRLDQMKRILFDAAHRHQILLFTCHPEHWRDLGVEPRDLLALKATPQN